MKTDKELLEMAAKAAGYDIKQGRNCTRMHPAMNFYAAPLWNPLENDGDALRLAVKLKVDVIPSWGHYCVCVIVGGDHFEEPQAPDEFSSMRRAIVRAAAAIGEAL